MFVFDPPRAHDRLPSGLPQERAAGSPKKCAARRGKSHRGAQERTRGNCSQLGMTEQGLCQLVKSSQNNELYEMRGARWGDTDCHFGADDSKLGRAA